MSPVCQSNGYFGAFSGCNRKSCGPVGKVMGYKSVGCTNTSLGAICPLVCDSGYAGTACDIMCQNNGMWSPRSGCERMSSLYTVVIISNQLFPLH